MEAAPKHPGLWWVLVSMRPRHWVKNLFLFAPALFSGRIADAAVMLTVSGGFVAFCLAASAIYLFNDVVDRERDRHDPAKRLRPLAAGLLSVRAALAVATVLLGAAAVLAAAAPAAFALLLGAYVANNLLYSLWIKNKVIADVISIAAGFVIRILAGAVLVDVQASHWLIVCTFTLALLLGFGKRRAELRFAETARPVNVSYSDEKLDHMISVSAAMAMVTYCLYALSPENIARYGGDYFVYTVPFVVYGVFRYVNKIQEGRAKDPVHLLYSDPVSMVNVMIWLGVSAAIVLLARGHP
jgi:4-hydroxybenzoate polyprenyltransferase